VTTYNRAGHVNFWFWLCAKPKCSSHTGGAHCPWKIRIMVAVRLHKLGLFDGAIFALFWQQKLVNKRWNEKLKVLKLPMESYPQKRKETVIFFWMRVLWQQRKSVRWQKNCHGNPKSYSLVSSHYIPRSLTDQQTKVSLFCKWKRIASRTIVNNCSMNWCRARPYLIFRRQYCHSDP